MTGLRRFPHYAAFAFTAAVLGLALVPLLPRDTAALLAFDGAVAAFLVVLMLHLRGATASHLRSRAAEPGHGIMRGLALMVLAAVLVGLAAELRGGGHDLPRLLVAAGSLTMAWLFANSLFALHYMHLFYKPAGAHIAGGLEFPGNETAPDFSDFLYFAVTIGMTFQVSDIVITARPVRRLVLAHAMMSFAFNIAVIALTVSVMASALA